MNPQILVESQRSGFIEKQHFGFIKIIDNKGKVISCIGDDEDKLFPFRSAAKPLQASLLILSGAIKHFDLSDSEIAITCGSHAGTGEHVKQVQKIMRKIKLTEDSLQCGIHEPLDKEARNNLIRNNITPTQFHNNCSGKHAGMLAVCMKNNWDTANYLSPEHKIQKWIHYTIEIICESKNLPYTIDGCGAPVAVLPHSKMALGFLNLFLNDNYYSIKKSMQNKPFYLGGKERLDTAIIEATNGSLLAKVAAEGLCIVVNLREKQALIVKILDANQEARTIAVIDALLQLKWMTKKQVLASADITNLYKKEIKDHKGKIVGEKKSLFKI